MTTSTRATTPTGPAPLHVAAELTLERLSDFLAAETERWSAVDPDLAPVLRELDRFCAGGGKRVRPGFAYWTFLGAGGASDDARIVDLCAGLELLHSFALLHDDVMDGSDTRRHHETTHVAAARRHLASAWRGEARRFGEGVAILLGDLALTYADRLLGGADPVTRGVYDELKTELMVGQYLDLVSAARGDVDGARGQRIVLYKSAKYTVERPMHLGAALAGRYEELGPRLSEVGVPLGEAFQLRDDLLGVFGDPSAVGKPVGDDLREGKATPLLSLATERADAGQRTGLALVGTDLDPEDVARICQVLDDTGATAALEERIDQLTDRAIGSLERLPLEEPGRSALVALAAYVGRRER